MKNVTENNKLIAEFMGYPKHKIDFVGKRLNFENSKHNTYHKDWNWLMPVVEKIESFVLNDDNSFNVTIGATNYCVIQDSYGEIYENIEDSEETKLLTVYKAIIKFIKWYNEQK